MTYAFSYQGITSVPGAKNVVLKINKPVIPVSQADYITDENLTYTYFLAPKDGFYSLTLNISHAIGGGGQNSYNGLTLRILQNHSGQPLTDGAGLVLRSQQAFGILNVITGIFPLRKNTAVFGVAGRAPSGGPASALFCGFLLAEISVSEDRERSAVQFDE